MLQTPAGTESAPRLSELIRSRHQEIIDDWLQRVRTVPPAHDLPAPALIDHLPRILARMAAMTDREPGEAPVHLDTMPESHAIDRLGRGFDLDDVVREYALLRQCILDRWVRETGDFIRVTELRRLDAAVEHAVSQSVSEYASARERLLRAVDRIADAAMGSADVDTFLHHLLRVTVETTTAVDTGAVLLRDGDVLRVRAATGLEREVELGFTLKIGEGFAGTIAAEAKPLALTGGSDHPLVKSPILRQRGIKALYGVPLVHNGEVVGVAHMGSTTAREFSDEDKLLFRTMANRATAVIVQADLVEREREAHKELQATHARVLQIAASERQARKEMEEALARVDSLLSASPVGVAFLDRDLRYERINEALARHNGRPVEAHIGRTVREVVPEAADLVEPLLREVMEKGQPLRNVEYAAPGASPAEPARWFIADFFPVRLPSGEMLGIGGVVLDITDRRRAEEQMREAQRRTEETSALLDTLLARAPAGFAFLDRDLRYVRVNQALSDLHGVDVDGHVGRLLMDVLPKETAAQVEPLLRQVLRTGQPIVGQLISGEMSRQGGERRHMLSSYYPVPGPGGEALGIGAVTTDITEHKRAEERQQFLAEASRRLGSSLDCDQVVATIARLSVPSLGDRCAVYEVRENQLCEVALEPGPATPRPSSPLATAPEVADLLRGEEPRAYQRIPQSLAPLLGDGIPSGTIVLAPLRARQRPIGLLAVSAGSTGQERSPPVELIDEFARRASIALDNAHLYREAQRATTTREQVLAVVSHDLKNPISVVQMNAQLLRRPHATPPDRQLDAIERALDTMNHLIADLLDMATIQGGNLAVTLEPTHVAALVAETIALHEPLAAGQGLRLKAEPVSPELVVSADHRRVQQVFGNLIGNAVRFSPAGSTITVNAAVQDGEVVFSVADRGPGIAPDELSKIFEPYWSGQRQGKRSTGLGLFISQGILRAHGGRIWVDSQPGNGSTFHFALPLVPSERAPDHVDGTR